MNSFTMYAASLFLLYLGLVNTQFYNKGVFKEITLNEESEIVLARSPIECILRCRRLTKEAFYTNDGKCVCLESNFESNDNENGLEASGNIYTGKYVGKMNSVAQLTKQSTGWVFI